MSGQAPAGHAARGRARPRAAAVVVLLLVPLLAWLDDAARAGEATGVVTSPALLGSGDPVALLAAAAGAARLPHVGTAVVVSFLPDGPRVAELDVRVDVLGDMELRRPTRWLLGGVDAAYLRDELGATALPPLPRIAGSHGLDVDLVLRHWDATVGPPRRLDTGTATPVHLVRRAGVPVEEVIYVDAATSLAVRRETRAPDGAVLRVVAYTDLSLVELPGPARLAATPDPTAQDTAAASLVDARSQGYDVPVALAGGFDLLSVGGDDAMMTARYGDGLSVLSVYQQPGTLDAGALDGAMVTHIAGRDAWTWVGAEPTTVVWTGDDHTWTVVTDAPMVVLDEALGSLPGDLVGHDVPSRIRRGLQRVWTWLTGGDG